MRRFVIFSAARSGTSLVVSTLNQHPDLLCHGEVFHPRPTWHLKGNLAEVDPATLDRSGMAFVDQVFSAAPGRRAVGFKMWRNQAEGIADALLADESVAKIILDRPNLLACYSSTLLARETQVWNVGAGKAVPDEIAEAQVAFEPRGFQKFVEARNEQFAIYRTLSRGLTLDLAYGDVVRDGVAPILDFLGLEPTPLPFGKVRLHAPDILGRFTDESRDEARAAIERLGHPDWASE